MEKPIQESYISIMSNKVKMHGGINLAQGLPGFEPPKELLNCLQNIGLTSVHQYPPATGNFALVEHIQNEYRSKLDLSLFHPLITCGATEAISLIYNYLHLKLNDSYAVLAFNPSYESYRRLPELYGVPFISFGKLDDEVIDFESLEKTIVQQKVKILFLSSPGNPHGRCYSVEEIEKLIEFSKLHKFYLILDDVYSELYFDYPPNIPYQKLHEYCFLVNSFSKRFSITGWRVGFLFAHQTHFLAIKNMHDYTGLCAPSVLQTALADFLNFPEASNQYVQTLRRNIKSGFDFYKNELEKIGFFIPKINGGYFVWTRLPNHISNGVTFANYLFDHYKVAVVPGIHFSDDASSWIRINIARPENELIEALNLIKIAVSSLNRGV